MGGSRGGIIGKERRVQRKSSAGFQQTRPGSNFKDFRQVRKEFIWCESWKRRRTNSRARMKPLHNWRTNWFAWNWPSQKTRDTPMQQLAEMLGCVKCIFEFDLNLNSQPSICNFKPPGCSPKPRQGSSGFKLVSIRRALISFLHFRYLSRCFSTPSKKSSRSIYRELLKDTDLWNYSLYSEFQSAIALSTSFSPQCWTPLRQGPANSGDGAGSRNPAQREVSFGNCISEPPNSLGPWSFQPGEVSLAMLFFSVVVALSLCVN